MGVVDGGGGRTCDGRWVVRIWMIGKAGGDVVFCAGCSARSGGLVSLSDNRWRGK